jgi:hypothetical protein
MSLDDVVIIMSIPRRLVLAIRQRKGNKGSGSPSLPPRSEHKPPPVVVIKRELRDEDMMDEMDHGHSNRLDAACVVRSDVYDCVITQGHWKPTTKTHGGWKRDDRIEIQIGIGIDELFPGSIVRSRPLLQQ